LDFLSFGTAPQPTADALFSFERGDFSAEQLAFDFDLFWGVLGDGFSHCFRIVSGGKDLGKRAFFQPGDLATGFGVADADGALSFGCLAQGELEEFSTQLTLSVERGVGVGSGSTGGGIQEWNCGRLFFHFGVRDGGDSVGIFQRCASATGDRECCFCDGAERLDPDEQEALRGIYHSWGCGAGHGRDHSQFLFQFG